MVLRITWLWSIVFSSGFAGLPTDHCGLDSDLDCAGKLQSHMRTLAWSRYRDPCIFADWIQGKKVPLGPQSITNQIGRVRLRWLNFVINSFFMHEVPLIFALSLSLFLSLCLSLSLSILSLTRQFSPFLIHRWKWVPLTHEREFYFPFDAENENLNRIGGDANVMAHSMHNFWQREKLMERLTTLIIRVAINSSNHGSLGWLQKMQNAIFVLLTKTFGLCVIRSFFFFAIGHTFK